MLFFSLSSSALLLSPQITFRLLLLFYESRWYACRRGERDVGPCCTRLHAGHFGAALRLCMSQYSYLPSPPTAADAAALASTEGTAGGRNRGRRRRFARDGYAVVHSCPLLVTTGNAVREVEVNVTACCRGLGDDSRYARVCLVGAGPRTVDRAPHLLEAPLGVGVARSSVGYQFTYHNHKNHKNKIEIIFIDYRRGTGQYYGPAARKHQRLVRRRIEIQPPVF